MLLQGTNIIQVNKNISSVDLNHYKKNNGI